MYRCIVVALFLLSSACTGSKRAWETIPLATPISLQQHVGPGELVVLVLDAHTNAAVPNAQVILTSRAVMLTADSAGLVRFANLPSTTHDIRVRWFGYSNWTGAVTIRDRGGAVLVVQLKREKIELQNVIVGPGT